MEALRMLSHEEHSRPSTSMAPALKVGLLTRDARAYGLRELLRRAGFARELFQSCGVSFAEDHISVRIGDTGKRIRFASTPPEHTDIAAFNSVTRASWPETPSDHSALVPDLCVPFCWDARLQGHPLVTLRSDTLESAFDLPLVTLLSLTRYEEQISTVRDVHGRFPGSASVAARYDFLHRPIVD